MNGWTPTPTNKERVEYDLQRNEEFIGKSLAYNLSRTFATTEAEADQLHELIGICDTDPAHILNTQQEVKWDESSDTVSEIVTVTKITPDMAYHGYVFNARRFEDENKARKELHDTYNIMFK